MKLRTQFLLFAAASTLLSAAASAVGLGLMERSALRRDSAEKARLVADSVEKAAREALLLDDPSAAVSYFRFLRTQFPSLEYAKLSWREGGRERDITVGEPSPGADVRASSFADPRHGAARLEVGLDPEVLGRDLAAAESRLEREAALVALLLLAGGGALSFAWSLRVLRPLGLLSEGAEAVGAGRLDVRLEHASEDELGQLVSAFNRMSSRLAELDQLKKDFVSGVSHELRSPVAAVESMVNVLLSKPADAPANREYLERARSNLQRLNAFIDNLLDAAKIEKGRVELKPEDVPLKPAVVEVLGLFEAKAGEKGVSLEARPGEYRLRADGEALRRVLVNLVSNALKFTPKGGRVSLAARSSGGRVEIDVSDTGQGIPPDELPSLFERFARGRSAARTPGTGLGLYLVKQTVEAHGGNVAVRSAPGVGTTFTVSWPAS